MQSASDMQVQPIVEYGMATFSPLKSLHAPTAQKPRTAHTLKSAQHIVDRFKPFICMFGFLVLLAPWSQDGQMVSSQR